jgi:hypothetical protein
MTTPNGSAEVAKRSSPRTPWVEIVVLGVVGMTLGLISALVMSLPGPDNPVQVCGIETQPPGTGAKIIISVFGTVIYSRIGNRLSDFDTEWALAYWLPLITLSCLGFAVGASIAVLWVRCVKCRSSKSIRPHEHA